MREFSNTRCQHNPVATEETIFILPQAEGYGYKDALWA
jgi:hypothetical protein